MARLSAWIAVALAVGYVFTPKAWAQETDAVEAEIREAWAATASVIAALSMDATASQMPVSGVGEVRVLKRDDKTYYGQEINLDFPPTMGVGATIETLFDGTGLYVVNTMLGQAEAFKTRPAISEAPPPPDTAMLLDAVKARYTLALAEGENVDDRATVWFEGTRTATSERVESIRIGFDRETGFPLQIELHTPELADPVVLRHSALRVNTELNVEDFVFEAPEGVQVQTVDPPQETPAEEPADAPPAEDAPAEDAPAEDAPAEEGVETETPPAAAE